MAVSSTSSSSSISSMLGVTGKGIGGLVSGLNTDELVEALTAGTRSKISKQGQQKQLLNWKMTAYRSMATALRAFQSKTLSYSASSNTNISSNAFFNTYKATSSSSKVTLNATSDATTGTFNIDSIQQLATSASLSSKKSLSPELSLNLSGSDYTSSSFTGQTLKIDVDGKVRTISLDTLNTSVNADGTINKGTFTTELQRLLDNAVGQKTVNGQKVGIVKVEEGTNGQLKLNSDASTIYITEDNDLLGVKYGNSNRIDPSKITLGDISSLNNLQGNVFKFNINGVELTATKDDTLSSLLTKINSSDAGVTARYSEYTGSITLTAKTTGAGANIDVKDVQGNLMNQLFGAQGGSSVGSNYLITNTTDHSTVSQMENKIKQIESDAALSSGLQALNNDLANKIQTETEKLKAESKSEEDIATAIAELTSEFKEKDDYKNAQAIYDKQVTDEMKTLGKALNNADFNLTVNGVTKTVKFNTTSKSSDFSNGTFSFQDILDAANKGIQSAFSSTVGVKLVNDGNGNTVITSDANTSVSISGSGYGANVLGFTETTSNVNLILNNASATSSTALNAVTFADLGTDNATISMTINGKTKTLDLGSDFNWTNAATELNDEIKAKFEAEFGSDIASKVSFVSQAITKQEASMKSVPDTDADPDGDLGITKLIPELDEDGKQIYNTVTTGYTLKLEVKDPSLSVTMDSGSTVGSNVDVYEKLGFGSEPVTVGYAGGTRFSDLNMAQPSSATANDGLKSGTLDINDVKVEYSSDMYIQDFVDKVNNAFNGTAIASITNGQLTITGTGSNGITIKEATGTSGNMLSKIFGINGEYKTAGAEYSTGTDSASTTSNYREGKNAEVVIDGVVVSKQTNTFTYNGVEVTVNEVSGPTDAPITINVASDPEDVVKRIKDWMEDYNALVYTLNQAINESKNGDYFPLTDEQKSEMTEDQIKTWETEAKKGILRNDNTLRQILSDMRSSMLEKVESAGISLYDIGITTKGRTGDLNESGQLMFDANVSGGGEARLRQMLINEPDKVRMLFTDTENGLASRLNKVITSATNTSSISRGTLVSIAGTETLTGDNSSTLGKKISAIDTFINQLKTRLESEYNRQWKKFSALELVVQKMNTQSSFFSQS